VTAAALGELQLVAVGAAFLSVFAVFVAALVALAVVTLRWAVGRDRRARKEWLLRHRDSEAPASGPAPPHADGRPQRGTDETRREPGGTG
jgi:hypothetical protein